MADMHWFDQLLLRLSNGIPRREMLHSISSVAAGYVIGGTPRPGAAKRKKGKGRGKGKGARKGKGKKKTKPAPGLCGAERCAADQKCCPDAFGMSCVNTDIDPDNCGRCGRACRLDQECFHGSCFCQGDFERDCDGRCIDVSGDNNNCGGCNVVCAADRHCAEGNCEPGEPVSCPEGFAQCAGDTCVNLKTHDAHCGRCFGSCARDAGPSRHCVNGLCEILTANDVKPCTTSGGGTVHVPKDWVCCNNPQGFCFEGARCGLFGQCIADCDSPCGSGVACCQGSG